MPEKDPTNWALGTWLLGLCMSLAGGWVSFHSKVKAGRARAFNLTELVGEMVVSGVVGIGAYMTAIGLDAPAAIAAALAGIGGHMGARLLFLAERHLEAIAERIVEKGKP